MKIFRRLVYLTPSMEKQRYNIIKEVLARKGITAVALAEEIGVHENTISNWSQNKSQPSIQMLFLVARILEVKPGDLLVDPDTLPRKK